MCVGYCVVLMWFAVLVCVYCYCRVLLLVAVTFCVFVVVLRRCACFVVLCGLVFVCVVVC